MARGWPSRRTSTTRTAGADAPGQGRRRPAHSPSAHPTATDTARGASVTARPRPNAKEYVMQIRNLAALAIMSVALLGAGAASAAENTVSVPAGFAAQLEQA